MIQLDFGFTGFLINLIIGVIIISPILWLVGRSMVGKEKAKFTDAIWITLLGIIIGSLVGKFLHGWIGFIVSLIVWLLLIRHFFDAGLGRSILIAIIAVIILIAIAIILTIIGITVFSGLLGSII